MKLQPSFDQSSHRGMKQWDTPYLGDDGMTELTRQLSLQARLRKRLEESPEGSCLAFVDETPDLHWLKFQDFYQAAAARSTIMAEYGMKPGHACVIVAHSDKFCAETIIACLLGGALPVLVAPPVVGGLHSNLREIVRHVVRKTGARIVVSGEEDSAQMQELSHKVNVLIGPESTANGDAAMAHLVYPTGNDIAAMQLTSGTTGLPRICVWRQQSVLAALDGMGKAMGLTPEDLYVNWTPLYHDMGLANNFLLCLIKRIPLAMINTFQFVRQPSLWLNTLARTGATITWSPNFGYAITTQRVRDSEIEGIRLDRVRGFWNAAERIHLETFLAFQKRFAPYGVSQEALKTSLGCAENVGSATFSNPRGRFVFEHVDRQILHEKNVAVPVPEDSKDDRAVGIVGLGCPFPGAQVKICDPNGRSMPEGHIGEITFDTPSRMVGYLKDTRSTSRAIRDGALRTGDLGYLRGEELFWVGRLKERINIRGNKYDPSDLEKVLLHIDGLREGCFATFGVDDPQTGTQRLIIISEIRENKVRSNDSILQEIRERIAREVGISVDEIILLKQGTMSKTSSGKRRHKFYRDLFLQNQLAPIAHLIARLRA
jgi:acyl-CoA synthetase (AMP-forming)/AMP-acid ligase II